MRKAGKLKVLIATGIYPPDIGGPATYSKLLFEELPGRDIGVTVVSFGSVRKLPKVLRHFVYFLKIIVKGIRSDIIFAQDPVSVGLPSMLASKVIRKKFMIKIVGDYAWEQGVLRYGITDSLDNFSRIKKGYPLYVKMLKIVQKMVAKNARVIITPSNYLKTVVSNWGVSKRKIVVIYNAFEVPDNVANKKVLRQLMQLNEKVVVSVGRLVPWKGFKTLIGIMPQLISEFPDIRLLIIGSGPQKDELQEYIDEQYLGNHITLVGALDHETLLRYLRASDVFALNTFYEGFSHQLLECMALDLPVVTTDVGGNPELIDNKKNGLLVPYDDKKALKNSISLMLKDKKLSEKFAKSAKIKVKQFNKEALVDNTVEILKKV